MNLDMLKQARELQSKIAQAQKELKRMQVETEAGKGAVKIVMNGEQRVLSVKIDPALVDLKNTRQLEIFLLKALNDAQDKVEKVAARTLKEATGGMKIPGLF
jgi:DNA-binding YbaB/EbfC family protein